MDPWQTLANPFSAARDRQKTAQPTPLPEKAHFFGGTNDKEHWLTYLESNSYKQKRQAILLS
jgi:hypothetical protein